MKPSGMDQPATRPPADPARRSEWLAARAKVARRHHPDLGGDVSEFIAALAEVDAAFAATTRAADGRWVRLRRGVNRSVRRRRSTLRTLRARLPRKVPGARRYIDL